MNGLIEQLRSVPEHKDVDGSLCREAADAIEMLQLAIDRNVKLADKYNAAADKVLALTDELIELKSRSCAGCKWQVHADNSFPVYKWCLFTRPKDCCSKWEAKA